MNRNLKIVILILLIFIIILFTKKLEYTSLTKGQIIVEIVDLENNVISKEISYKSGDKLSSLLTDNFENVKIEDGFIYSIENLETPKDFSHFISIYVNHELSDVGLESIVFSNGMIITFKDTKYLDNYES